MRSLMKHVLLLGNQAAGPAPFSDDFNRADGALGNGWTGATWAISGNKAINTPTEGASVVINGTFDDESNWILGANWSIGSGVATKTAGGFNGVQQNSILTTGQWYAVRASVASTLGGEIAHFHVLGVFSNKVLNFSGHATSANLLINGNSPAYGTLDNVVAHPISGLFAYRTFTSGDAGASAKITRAAIPIEHQGGIAHYVDDDNYVAAHLDYIASSTQRVMLIKRVGGGTPSIIANVVSAYSAGAALTLTRTGTNYSVGYNGSTVINATAITDAVFASADKWGLFSTASSTTFDDFAWSAA